MALSPNRRFARFLDEHHGRKTAAEMALGSLAGGTVSIAKDDEFADRFFLRLNGNPGVMLFTLTGVESTELAVALKQAAEDLNAAD